MLFPGNYTVVETQPTDYANVSEVDGGDDGDNLDSSILNSIPVIVSPGETDSGNDFVEEQFWFSYGQCQCQYQHRDTESRQHHDSASRYQ